MSPTQETWTHELGELWRLAWPMILAQLGFMTMGLVDTLMVGHVGQLALAGVSLGNLWSFAFIIFGMGLLRGLDPYFAQAHGAGDRRSVEIVLGRALVMATLAALPITAVHALAGPGLLELGQPEQAASVAASYCMRTGFSVLPMMLFLTISQLFQNLGKPRSPMIVVAMGNVINLALNGVLVFGVEALGIQGMGAMGTAWATLSVRWAMLILLVIVGWPLLSPYMPRDLSPILAWRAQLKMWTQVLPVGFQSALESWAFTAMGLMVGVFGERALAAHSIALNLASLSFMVVLGLSGAAAARVGHLLGAGKPWRRAGWLAVGMSVAWMSCSATVFLTQSTRLASLFTHEQAVIAMAATLLPVAASFQLFDGVQAVAFGVLRGAGDTRWPALANILGYWLLGLPLAYFVGVHQGRGPVVIWQCVALALVVVSVTLLIRLRVIMARGGIRVERAE